MVEADTSLIPIEGITEVIHVIRGQKVILDADLARLYGVTTKRLNEQLRRNPERFPSDFMFQLTRDEVRDLRSQNATSSEWGGRRYMPYAFTEHGAVMAASVLNSPQAVSISVYVVRAFVRFREFLSRHQELSDRLDELEVKVDTHDREIGMLIQMIRELVGPPDRFPPARDRGVTIRRPSVPSTRSGGILAGNPFSRAKSLRGFAIRFFRRSSSCPRSHS
mgnify:CR=1 FL=1